jgi:ribonuclease BN (tRNA processing enzyme)
MIVETPMAAVRVAARPRCDLMVTMIVHGAAESGRVGRLASMQVTVLGCAGTFPNADSPCSAYLVEHDGFRVLLDVGSGAVGALQRHVGLLDVDAVHLSHLHADHCLDLIAYSYARRFHPDGPPPVLPVYGPAGTQERILRAFDSPPPPDRLSDVYEFRTTTAGSTSIGPFEVTLARTAHPVETYAITLKAAGRAVTYTGDSGPCDDVAVVARGSDLFLCEATWSSGLDYPPDLHMTAQQAGTHAAKAEVGRLLLVHTTPFTSPERLLAEAAEEYDGPLEIARAGTTSTV